MRQLIARTRGNRQRAHAPAAADKAHESTDEGLRECEWLERAGELEAALDCYRRHAAAHPGSIEAKIVIANTLMSRVGASLLSAAGLETLVARTPEDYIELAVALASDPPRRQRLRATMRERLQGSRLLDHAGFTRRLEGAYRDAWRALCLTDTRDTVTP